MLTFIIPLTKIAATTVFNHMVKYSGSQLDAVFHALADTTRREILAKLASGDAVVTELAKPFNISLPAISKHLNVLEHAGLIQRHKSGRIRRCQLTPAPLATAAEWIQHYQQFWNTQIDSLEKYLSKNKSKATTSTKRSNKKE